MAKTTKAGNTPEEWPEMMVVPPAHNMDAELVQADIERLVRMFKAHPESRWVEMSKIILGGKYDPKKNEGELILYLRTRLEPDDLPGYRSALEGTFAEWLQTLPDSKAERLVEWKFGFEVQSEAARNVTKKGPAQIGER